MATTEQLKARVSAEIDRRKGEIMAISEHIMKHPESGYREMRTAEFVAGWFRRMGLECREGLALTGVKTRLRGRSRSADTTSSSRNARAASEAACRPATAR